MFELVQADAAFGRAVISTFGQAGGWQTRRANGTNAVKTQLVLNDQIFNMAAVGYHSGGDYSSIGRVLLQAFATESWTSTAQGAIFRISVTTTGGTTAATYTFQNDGSLEFGGSRAQSPQQSHACDLAPFGDRIIF